jgi:hypothetical protein
MDEKAKVDKGKRKQKDKAAPTFHLAQSSLEKINEIIKGYARKNGSMRLEEIAKEICKREAPISVAHGFLTDIGIIEEIGVEKQSSRIGKRLGRLLALENPEDIMEVWQDIIINNSFCKTVLEKIELKGEIDNKTLRKLICFDAGYDIGLDGEPIPRDINTGSIALIKIFDLAGFITISGNKIKVSDPFISARDGVKLIQNDKKNFFISEERNAILANLDIELKQRCISLLSAGSADPKIWDSVIRTAGVILEERLRDIGKVTDKSRRGRDLVNDVFGDKGTLATKIPSDSERIGYREMYAGIVGVFRNPFAHRLIDPTPEDGYTVVIFVNLLLKMLEDLR